jgi:hypothetical protein
MINMQAATVIIAFFVDQKALALNTYTFYFRPLKHLASVSIFFHFSDLFKQAFLYCVSFHGVLVQTFFNL